MAAKENTREHSKSQLDGIKCAITNLPLSATPQELARQELLRRILELGYSRNNLFLNSNFLGWNGQSFSADIIVFSESAVLHIEPLLIACVDKESANFNYAWVESFQNSGARTIIWFNSKILKIFILNQDNRYFEIPPFIPSFSQVSNPEHLGSYRSKSSLSIGYDLKRTLSDLHDHFYGNSNIRIPSRLGVEIQKLLLVKKFDEEQPSDVCEFYIANSELPCGLNGSRTVPPLAFKTVASRLRRLAAKHDENKSQEQKIGHLELDDPSLYYAVFHLEGISLTKTPSDVLGDALETFRTYAIKREGGQFFTHQYVVKLALDLIEFSGRESQTLADISCGTSGFLHEARKRIIKFTEEKNCTPEEKASLVSDLLLGVEIDQDLVQISNTSPEFSNLPQKMVIRHDSLAAFEVWSQELKDRLEFNSRDFMVGNPPFGTKITVKDSEILNKFNLANAWTKNDIIWKQNKQRTVPRSPDILFIERNLNCLAPEGKMVLVVPYQILSGPKEGYVREWIMTNCKLIAVIDLPEDTFQPYTGTKGSLLVVQKRKLPHPNWEQEEDYPIFMACPQKIGHDRRGKPIFKYENSEQIDTDLPEVSNAFKQFIDGKDPNLVSPVAFTISSKSIRRDTDIRLNAAYYKPSSSNLRSQIQLIIENNQSFITTPLGDLVNDIFYPGRFKRDYTENIDESVPFLGGSNITELIPFTKKRLLKKSPYYSSLALQAGWILITRSGTTGIVSMVPEDWDGFAASEHIIRVIPNPNKLHPGYLYGYLRSEIGQKLLRDGVFGSVIDEINCNYIASIPVLYPKDPKKVEVMGKKILEANELRAKASRLITETTNDIEKVIS